MPIPVNVIDNKSQVRVKSNCDVEKTRLDVLIKQEREERIAADDALQEHIDESISTEAEAREQADTVLADALAAETEAREQADAELRRQKQDEIQFIYITSLEGALDSESLNLLISNKVNRLVLSDVIYYLSVVNGTTRKYFSRVPSSVYNEIDIDINTGEYEAISKMDPAIKNHIEDETIHITEEERLFWNNKVSASADKISSTDYQLNLSIN